MPKLPPNMTVETLNLILAAYQFALDECQGDHRLAQMRIEHAFAIVSGDFKWTKVRETVHNALVWAMLAGKQQGSIYGDSYGLPPNETCVDFGNYECKTS